MATLNSFQKLTRVLPGLPFGNGSDGTYSSATIPTLTKDSCSGTAASTTLTTSGSTFANGDILLIHQTRGTGVGQWEVNRVSSGGGTATLTLQLALQYTYTDSGASQAQAIKIPQYLNVTVQAGTWTVPSWDGNVGGVFPIAVKGDLTITGTATARNGFRGGTTISGQQGIQAEGSAGTGTYSTAANGNGGGGGQGGNNAGAGGGGGHAATGTTGGSDAGAGGTGGSLVGSADMTSIFLGGGGGDAGDYVSNDPTAGGAGGALVIFFAKNVASIAGSITVNGNDGNNPTDPDRGGGGGGAGGGVLIVCQTATLGTTKITATGGNGGSRAGSATGGAGAVGRITVHHSGTVTGTTNPSFTDVTDTGLVENSFLGSMI